MLKLFPASFILRPCLAIGRRHQLLILRERSAARKDGMHHLKRIKMAKILISLLALAGLFTSCPRNSDEYSEAVLFRSIATPHTCGPSSLCIFVGYRRRRFSHYKKI